jgi:choline dehydrogenase-like flavoprotein
MMPELLGGCVGSDLTVYGTRQLSVVDASIIPLVPATHLQSTMYAVAEKAADIIKQRNAVQAFFPVFGFWRR